MPFALFHDRRFQFRPVLTIFSIVALTILVSLGSWQLKRLEWKQALIAKVEERALEAPIPFDDAVKMAEAGEDMEYAPVQLTGRIRPDAEARVFGSYEGMAGVYLFVMVQRQEDISAYANLGFVPQTIAPASFSTDHISGEMQDKITGLFRYAERPSPPASWFVPMEQSGDGLWFVRDPERFALQEGGKTLPYYVDSFARGQNEWPKGGTTRLDFSNRHLEYALTWFGLAAALCGVWAAFSLPKV